MDNTQIIKKLELLKEKGLVEPAFLNIKRWLEEDRYLEFVEDLLKIIEKEDVEELNDSFYQVLPFGTAGRRGRMGIGDNRINILTISESAQGLIDYLFDIYPVEEVKKRGVVVTYDVRHNSLLYAQTAATVFAANDVKVYFFDGVRSTPQLSFTIRHKKTIAGIMISASHNIPADNGIKIFAETGGQIVPPHDIGIIKKAQAVKIIKKDDFYDALEEEKIVIVTEDIDSAYHQTVASLTLNEDRDIKIVFTPLHGCASTSFLPVLKEVGFRDIVLVEEQMAFDANFTNVANQIPNPEVPISLELAIKYAKKNKADIVLAADPDADRIGVVSKKDLKSSDYIFLNGNQIGVLIFDYIVSRLKEKQKLQTSNYLIKTVVTTELLTKIAKDNGLNVIGDLPVGFKYIGDIIEQKIDKGEFLFGAEESHGYLHGDYARDKDGAIAALFVCEYAALLKKENKTLFEQLENIKKEYGYYRELLQNVYYLGMDGREKMIKIMHVLREEMPDKIGDIEVFEVLDQRKKVFINPKNKQVIREYEGYEDDSLIFYLNEEKTNRVVVRPSGTEPKIKFYIAQGQELENKEDEREYKEVKKQVDDSVFKVLEEFVKYAENISPGGKRFEILG